MNRFRFIFQPVMLLILSVALAGCSASGPDIVMVQGPIMGTHYHVKYVEDHSVDRQRVEKAVLGALQEVDQRMSTYKPKSELMRFNDAPVDEPFHASKELVDLIARSDAFSRMSNGAFDVTIGPLVNLWGFGPGYERDQVPPEEKIKKLLSEVGYQSVKVDTENNILTKSHPVFVDLSGIAKGYSVDKVAEALDQLGIHNYLVEVGGELRVGGHKPDGSDWKIGVEEPDTLTQVARSVIVAPGKGIATSGDYRNYFEVNGKRYSHTIDPRTGYPISNHLASVTVVADTDADADGMATMFMVLGEKEGLALANEKGIAAYFIYKEDGEFVSAYSKAFSPYLRRELIKS